MSPTIRTLPPFILMACLGMLMIGCADAQLMTPTSLCNRDEVVYEVANEIRRRNPYAVAERTTTTERPTNALHVVQCTMLSRVGVLGPEVADSRPTYYELYAYQVQIIDRRFRVVFMEASVGSMNLPF